MSTILGLEKEIRSPILKNSKINLFVSNNGNLESTDSIKTATDLKFGDSEKVYKLDQITDFYNDDKAQTLRSVIFCWMHDKSSIVDYKNDCLKNGIPDFKFLVKTELTTWLSGKSDSCSFIKKDTKPDAISEQNSTGKISEQNVPQKKRKLDDPQIERISHYERESVNHNAILRGSKNIEFNYLISDAKKFINQLKKSNPSKSDSKSKASNGTHKQPIIIISPASTSLISLTNIKEFLEDGKFIEPSKSQNKKPDNGIITITHKNEKLISSAQNIMVVDNVDLFTKPEYWDRVIAIFTTGHAWQFSKYKYTKPELLFQRYKGFFVNYQGDITPKQIKDWNVSELKVDRVERRFKDKLVVRDFWAQIERILIAKGYSKN